MLSGWESGGEEITRANSAQLFVLLSPNETDSPETPKLAITPHSLATLQLVPSLLHQTFSQKLNKHPETKAFLETKPHILYSGIFKNTQSSVTEQSLSKLWQEWGNSSVSQLVLSLGWNAPGGKDTVVLMMEWASGCSVSTEQSCRDCKLCQVFISIDLCAWCPAPARSCLHKETALDLCRTADNPEYPTQNISPLCHLVMGPWAGSSASAHTPWNVLAWSNHWEMGVVCVLNLTLL